MSLSHKEQADASFKGGDWQTAVNHYANAIEEIKGGGDSASKESKEKLMKLYSNRSSAYQQLKNYDLAHTDADLCISCDPQWYKGYVQKGNCLTFLKKTTEAYNAYNTALRLSPNDQDVQKKCEKAEEAIRNEACARESYSSSSSSSSFRSSSGSSSSSSSGGYQLAQGLLGKVQMYARVALFFSFTVASLPFVSFLLGRNLGALVARVSLYTFLASALASSLTRLYLLFGMPKMSAEYASKVAKHPLGMQFFLIFIAGFAGRFYLMLGLPLVATEATFYTNMMLEEAPKLGPLLKQYLPESMRAQAEQAVADFSRPGAAERVNEVITKLAGTSEVMAGMFFVLEMLMPTRNMVVTYLYWQYLGMRYANDNTGAIKEGFSHLDKQIRFFTDHKYCPAIVSKAYGMLGKVLLGQVQKFKPGGAGAAAGGGGGGIGGMFSKMASKCTIA